MIDPEREELLSAYLDGEVTPAERSRVESWLAESSELRQLRDELLAMRADLQALPRHKLARDLGASVLDRSDQAPLPAVSPAPPASAGLNVPGRIAEWWSRGSAAHRFFWPAVAVAAALAILVFDANQRTEERQVAQAPAPTAEPEMAQEPLASAADESRDLQVAEQEPSNRQEFYYDLNAKRRDAAGEDAPDAGQISAAPEPPAPAAPLSDIQLQQRNATAMQAQSRGAVPLGKVATNPGGALETKALPPAGAKTDSPPTIVCAVTPEYLQQNRFDELLSDNQVNFQRLSVPASLAAEDAKLESAGSLGPHPLRSLYFVEASDKQVTELISQVPQTSKLVEANLKNLPRMTRPPIELYNQPAAGIRVMLIAPGGEQASPTEAKGNVD